MKVILFLLGFTCLIGSLTAYSFDLPLENEDEIQPLSELEEFKPDELTWYISTVRPTTPSTTTIGSSTPMTTTTTRRPRPTTTTTRRPRPTTTRRPLPPPPPPKPQPPKLGNIQIFDNANRSLGPLAAHLINILQNKKGNQSTIQSNGVRYNVGLLNPIPRLFDQDTQEE